MCSLCYVLGDLCVLKLMNDCEGYENLKDCLVLFVRGLCFYVFECFGGDLSGEKFFVCWDKKIILSGNEKLCDYLFIKGVIICWILFKLFVKVIEKFKKNDNGKEVKYCEEMM